MSNYGESDLYTFDAELYDHVVPYRERQDIGFFLEAALESGGPVLEIGCGTGRVLIPTARAGIITNEEIGAVNRLAISPQVATRLKCCMAKGPVASPATRLAPRLAAIHTPTA